MEAVLYSILLHRSLYVNHMSASSFRNQIWKENEEFLDSLPPGEERARVRGKFFTFRESICDTDKMSSIEASQFPVISRSLDQGSALYPTAADVDLLESAEESKTEWSDTTNIHQKITAVDFLYNEVGEKAYLLSKAPVCHAAYFRLSQAATGFFAEEYTKRRKLLNGMKGRVRRIWDSGIKHSKYNKFHLFLQKSLFDATPPSLIIVPLLPLSRIKAWNGTTPYDAMVLPCGEKASYAASQTLMFVRSTCTREEVEVGIRILSVFVKDIAGSLLDIEHDVLEDFNLSVGETTDAAAVTWIKLVEYLRGLDSPKSPLPSLKENLDWDEIKVAKGTFNYDISCLPDPFLLATKGAMNYSSYAGQKLMPVCKISDDSSDDDDSLSS